MANSSASTTSSSSAMAIQGGQRTFHPFPKLPPEIRLMVWKLHNGRVIPIYPINLSVTLLLSSSRAAGTSPRQPRNARTRAENPRTVDLAPRPHSSRISTWNSASAIEKRSIWVDWNKDVLYLTKIYFVGGHGYSPQSIIARLHNDVPDLQKLKHVAIHQTFDERRRTFVVACLCLIVLLLYENMVWDMWEEWRQEIQRETKRCRWLLSRQS
jgi:hypothetical protein